MKENDALSKTGAELICKKLWYINYVDMNARQIVVLHEHAYIMTHYWLATPMNANSKHGDSHVSLLLCT